MKIKNSAKKALLYSACVIIAMIMVGVFGTQIANNARDVSAQEYLDEQNDNFIEISEGGDYSASLDRLEGLPVDYSASLENVSLEEANDFPEEYDLRRRYPVRTINQWSEGLCWLLNIVWQKRRITTMKFLINT